MLESHQFGTGQLLIRSRPVPRYYNTIWRLEILDDISNCMYLDRVDLQSFFILSFSAQNMCFNVYTRVH